MRRWLVVFPGILGVGLLLQAVEPEKVDLGVLHRIKSEAFARNSKVMDTLFYLTDVYGPRLTGSPNINDAGNWAVKKMQEWVWSGRVRSFAGRRSGAGVGSDCVVSV